jgi:hypothetical protein
VWRPRARRLAPAPQPEERTIDSRHVSISVQRTGLVIRRRAGYTGWLPICDLKWADIRALELDSGTHDAARMLYASIRTSPMRKPLIDQAHLSTDQWFLLRDSVAAWTGQSVLIDLAHLGATDRDGPYDRF